MMWSYRVLQGRVCTLVKKTHAVSFVEKHPRVRQKTIPPPRFARHLPLHKGGEDGGDVSINFIFSIVGADSFVLPEEKRKKCTFFSIGCASGGGERC